MKVNLLISKYLLYFLPTIIITVIWALSIINNGGSELEKSSPLIYDIIVWNFIIWFFLFVYFLLSLLFYTTFRERILATITFSKERDERESYISGKASKATFFSTLSVLIILFFLSGLNVHIYKNPKEEAIDGKRGTIAIAYKFEFINSAKNKTKNIFKDKNNNSEEIFIMDGIPFSQEIILLFLILFHVTSYHIFTRRRLE
jgi:hypothetical protein